MLTKSHVHYTSVGQLENCKIILDCYVKKKKKKALYIAYLPQNCKSLIQPENTFFYED